MRMPTLFARWSCLSGVVACVVGCGARGAPDAGKSDASVVAAATPAARLGAAGTATSPRDDARFLPRTDPDGALVGRVAGHRMATRFEAGGVRLTRLAPKFGDPDEARGVIRTARIGREGTLLDLAETPATLDGDRVVYAREGGVREWYAHGPAGVEQGFDIAERPAGDGPLVIELETPGLTAKERVAGKTIELSGRDGNVAFAYGKAAARGSDGNNIPVALRVVEGNVRLVVADAGARYPIEIDPLVWGARQATLAPSDLQATTRFGAAIAVDGTTAVVGGPTGNLNTGEAYVFTQSGGTWTQQAILKASDGVPGDGFGCSVAISGGTIVVGAYHATVSGVSLAGAGYVFTGGGASWMEVQKIVSATPWSGVELGGAVATSASNVAVASTAGGVVVTGDASSSFAVQSEFVAINPESGQPAISSFFSPLPQNVALSGSTLFVGAPQGDTYHGTVAVYTLSGGAWSLATTIAAPSSPSQINFGAAVAAQGTTLFVDAPQFQSTLGDGGTAEGAVFVYSGFGAAWTNVTTLVGDALVGAFGSHMAASDGTLAVGAASGDVYLFTGSGTSWTPNVARSTAACGSGYSSYASVALAGTSVMAGLDQDGAGGEVLVLPTSEVCTATQTLTASDEHAGTSFGASVSLAGSLALVGAPSNVTYPAGPNGYQGSNGAAPGAAYVFNQSGTSWPQQARLTAGTSGASFGVSTALVGATAVVGAPGASGVGAVYVYTQTGTTWGTPATLTASGTKELGVGVAYDGATVVAVDPPSSVAYAWTLSGTTWSPAGSTSLPTTSPPSEPSGFVAVSGANILIGTTGSSAYLYSRTGSTWTQLAQMTPPIMGSATNNGCGVAMSGGVALVTQCEFPHNGYIYDAYQFDATGALKATVTSTNNSGPSGSMSFDGTTLAMAAPNDTGARLVTYGAGSWTSAALFVPIESDDTLTSVAVSGPTALIGSPTRNGNAGAVYVYAESAPNDGAACSSSDDCTSTYCANGFCCAIASCTTAGYTCVFPGQAGTCVADYGTSCSADSDCGSGFCTDGVCCDGTCTGQCQSCQVSGHVGHCTTTLAGSAPYGSRTACNTNGSGTPCAYTCNGTDSTECHAPGSTTSCGSPSCASSTTGTLVGACDTAGNCKQPTQACAPYDCEGSACLTTCAHDSDCQSGNWCNGSTCTAVYPQGGTCSSNDQCSTGACIAGICCNSPTSGCPTGEACSFSGHLGTCLKNNGQACAANTDCGSNFCVDGYCCNSACGGECQACDVPSALGSCIAVTGAPHGSRTACSTGGSNVCAARTCDGSTTTTCAGYANGSSYECAVPVCSSGAATPARYCDGAGSCTAASATSCAPFLCGATACSASCTQDDGTQCASNAWCNTSLGSCVVKAGNGGSCTASDQCASNNCVDGYCCNTACGGTCQACDVAGSQGTCTALAAGATPHGSRSACGGIGAGTTCGPQCTGATDGACHDPTSTTACGTASCNAGTQTAVGTCNGAGACTQTTTACNGFACNGGGTACDATCTVATQATDCASGYYCSGGACVKDVGLGTSCSASVPCSGGLFCTDGVCCGSASCGAGSTCDYAAKLAGTCYANNGTACTTSSQCGSGFCVDGVCCNSACNGLCQSCGNTTGTCTTLPTGSAPLPAHGTCSGTFTNATCEQVCNGSDPAACHSPGGSITCASTTCSGGKESDVGSCDGNGNCSQVTKACAPYLCGATTCNTSCAVDTDCAPGNYCNGTGQCVAQTGQGTLCTASDQCSGGQTCVNSVCCASASCGPCGTCAGVGAGSCTPLGRDATPTSSCGAYLCSGTSTSCATSCGTDADCTAGSFCSSTGACVSRGANGATCAAGNQCVSGNCVDDVCCTSAACGACGTCDGTTPGACSPLALDATPTSSCAGYLCGGSTTSCPTSCASDADCVAADYCNGAGQCVAKLALSTTCAANDACASGFCTNAVCCSVATCPTGQACNIPGHVGGCVPGNGSTCSTGTDCGSGNCVDGVCCDTSCTDDCEACDVSGHAGTCTPVVGAPHGSRPACDALAATDCAKKQCDGTTTATCQGYANTTSTPCGAAACTTDASGVIGASACDGLGSCKAPTATPCLPYKCSGAACGASCTADADCATGYTCSSSSGKCIQGATCSTDGTSSVDKNGNATSCSPYVCGSDGSCEQGCATTTDCAGGFTCIGGVCTTASSGNTASKGGCAIDARGSNEAGGESAFAAALLVAGAVIARRRQAHAS